MKFLFQRLPAPESLPRARASLLGNNKRQEKGG